MSWLALLLGIMLVAAGGEGLYASLDLRTTDLGNLYATCGAIGISGGFIVIAIGLLIRRVDALGRAILRRSETAVAVSAQQALPPSRPSAEAPFVGGLGEAGPSDEPSAEAPPPVMNPEPAPLVENGEPEAAPINENRTGSLPSLDTFENVPQEPPPPPTLVGRYSAGGANYSIFSDGSIEAETDQGAFKFASMREFKSYIASRRS